MKDELTSLSSELAAEFVARFASPEVRELIEQTKAAADAETGTFRVIGTSENLDRYSEVIKIDAWDTAHYLNNPVILWGHDHNRLIGMTTSIEVVEGNMIFKGKFAPTEEGQEKRRLYDLGFLKATSVGFIEKEREGNLITKAELLELSFVSVPANPFALSLAMEKGLSVNELVTKGLMFVEKDAEETVVETVPETETEEVEEAAADPIETPEPVLEQRSFSTKQLSPVIDSLKAVLIALEALGTDTEALEGDEAVQADETEEARSFAEFSEKRRILQQASTILGDVLAESRQAIEARS